MLLFASVWSATIAGIDGLLVRVEVDVAGGLPGLEIVGLADTSVRESRHRVRSALRNSGFDVPSRRITVNLSPASLHKEGSQMDLGIAVGILAASGQVPLGPRLAGHCFLGELALDGTVRAIRGTLAMVLSVRENNVRDVVIPEPNQGEVGFLPGDGVKVATDLRELVRFLRGERLLPAAKTVSGTGGSVAAGVDLSDIKGQKAAKRALQVACCGGHNILLSGPPGAGKSMLARAIPGILPELSPGEALEVTRIHSVAGLVLPGDGLVRARPFRAPHHTITASALIGGGAIPRPGEVSLSHRGVLFLDELPEFPPSVLNALRQPLEDGICVITRSRATYAFPSRFLLAASMNPCPCGFYTDKERQCTCTDYTRKQYVGRVSGPFLDRIDLHLEVGRIEASDLTKDPGGPSATAREMICEARRRQERRLAGTGLSTNGEMGPSQVSTLVTLSSAARKMALSAYTRMGLSTRGYYRVLKVATSVSDLAGSPRVEEEHLAEALSYRTRMPGGE